MKKTKKFIILFIILGLCLFLIWYVYEYIRGREYCQNYPEFKKANEIIQKIEDYRKCHGKLPDSLEDIGEETKMEGPIYYNKIDSQYYEKINPDEDVYIVSFSMGFTVGESCTYHSDTKIWR
ncbi:MAG: hypothetical protein NT166_03680 [Candidatus Aminicenantes bacterium]|nr:hypothetical protein [Candidatus Aminicenantes bacterium]